MKNRATCGFLSVIVVIALLVVALGVAGVVLFSRGSLGEKMNLIVNQDATAVPATAAPVVVVVTATPAPLENNPAADVVAESTPTATVEAAAAQAQDKGMCGNRGEMLLLFVGADFNGGNPPPGADAVRVIKVDYDQGKITVVAFPRDLYVQTPGLSGQNITATRLGLAYHYMKTGTMGSDKHRVTAATTLVGQALYDNFGIAPHNYMTLQMENVAAMVDAVGGIDINNPTAFYSERNIFFAEGPQTLDGPRAVEYVRTYLPGGDGARRQRQNLFVKAVEKTVLDAGIVAKIPELYKTFDKAITTDLSPKMIADLTCMAEQVPTDNVNFYEVSGADLVDEQQKDGWAILYPKVDAIRAKLIEWLGE